MNMYDGKFPKDINYKELFSKEVDSLVATNMPLPWRMKAVKDITDAYIIQTEEIPDWKQLDRLTDYILKDDLSDSHPDKVSNTEYPIMSDGQIKLRHNREKSNGANDYYTPSKKQAKKKTYVNRF